MLPSRSSETSSQFWIRKSTREPDEPADQRGEDHLVGPVGRLAELAQPAGDQRARGEEGEREADAERLQVERAEVDLGLHRRRRLAGTPTPSPTMVRCAESGARDLALRGAAARRARVTPRPGLTERQALREAAARRPAPRGERRRRCRCPMPRGARRAAAADELARIARTRGAVRVLVGVRAHAAPGRRGGARCDALGAQPERFEPIGVLAATRALGRPRSPRALARRPARGLRRARPHAAHRGRPARHRRPRTPASSTPGSTTTCAPATRWPPPAAARGATDRRDRHRPRHEPPRVRRPHRAHLRHRCRRHRRDRRRRSRDVRDRPDRGASTATASAARAWRATRSVLAVRASLDGTLHRRATCCAASTSRSGAAPTCST